MSKASLTRFITEVLQQEVTKITEPKRSGLPLDQLGLKPRGGVHNIITVYNQATPEEKEYWSKWYHNAKSDVEDLARDYGLPFPVVAAIVAVLSPGNKWTSNLTAASRLITGSDKVNSYPRQILRAKEILKTGDTSLVSGPKVTVFFNSLMNPKMVEKDMVLDGHAINIWRGQKLNLKGISTPGGKERSEMVRDYHTAAEQLGVPVQAVQAVTWYIWKYTGKSAPLEAPRGIYDVSGLKKTAPSNDVALAEVNAVGAGAIVGSGMGNGGTESSKKLLWSGDQPLKEGWYGRKSDDHIPTEEPGFFYHATNEDGLYGIIETGMMETHPPDYGTDQEEWPDGSVENRSYFGTSLQHVEPFFPENGKPTLLRIPQTAARFKKERVTGDIYTRDEIPASAFQVWSLKRGVWLPLGEIRQ